MSGPRRNKCDGLQLFRGREQSFFLSPSLGCIWVGRGTVVEREDMRKPSRRPRVAVVFSFK